MVMRMSTEISRAERLRSPLAIIVLDVDGFKQINDSYGHPVGDQVLREVSRSLLDSLRPYDTCVRFAGDEFVVLMADCQPDMADVKRRELQQCIEASALEVGSSVIRVGASAGVAVYPQDGLTEDALLTAADQRMYADKAERRRRGGLRGRVSFDRELVQVAPILSARPSVATHQH